MMSTAYTPVHVATCVLIITFGTGVYSNTEKKSCDGRTWYQNLLKEGLLSGELSVERKILKETIEKMIKKYTEGDQSDGMIDCSILASYEDMLGVSNKQADSMKDDDDTDIDETDFGDEEEESETDNTGDDKSATQHRETKTEQAEDPKNGDKEKVTSKDELDKPPSGHGDLGEMKSEGKKKRVVEKQVFDPLKGYITVLQEVDDDAMEQKRNEDNDEQNQVNSAQKTDSGNHADETSHNKGSTENKIHIDTNDELSNEKGNDNGIGKELAEKDRGTKAETGSTEAEGTTSKKTRTVEEFVFDPRKGYVKVVKEVEIDTEETDRHTEDQKKTAPNKNEEITSFLPEEETTLFLPEVETQNSIETTLEGRTQESKEKGKEEKQTQSTMQLIQKRCLKRNACDLSCYYGYSINHCLDHYPSLAFKDSSLDFELNAGTADSLNEQPKGSESSTPDTDQSLLQTAEQTSSRSRTSGLDEHELVGDNNGETGNTVNNERSESINTHEKTDSSHTHVPPKENSGQGFRDFTADLHRFELAFQQRAAEYANKIQNLEIMIIKLENQLLGERLNKQNSTTSFSKLENHILRLENELLKLNQSYAYLKEENDALRSRQRKYLELGHDKTQSTSENNGTKHYELITKQQSKISELSALLLNHTELFDKLQSRSQALEGQNQALYQIVMNQTALISNIMKKMQELSEENLKHRQETQDLKARLEVKTSSDRILEKLDNLVSTATVIRNVVDDGKPEENSKPPLPIYNFFPKSPDATVSTRPWQCDGNRSSRFCLLFSFILSPCPPFSTIYWKKCPYFLKDISTQLHEEFLPKHKEETEGSSITTRPSNIIADQNEVWEEKTDNSHEKIETNGQKESDERENLVSDSSPEYINKENQKEPPGEDTLTINVNTGEKPHQEDNMHIGTDNQNVYSADKELPLIHKATDDSKPDSEAPVEVLSDPPNDKATSEVKHNPEAPVKELPDVPPAEKDAKKDEPDSPPTAKEPPKAPPSPVPQKPRPEDRKLLYTNTKEDKAKDCYDHYMDGATRNGMYKIYVVGLEKTLPVYCDMKGGGWTILMKRSNGGTDFYKNWEEYKRGFGGLYSEHWIGNENLHYITNQDHYRLRVDLTDMKWDHVYAEYDTFWVDNQEESYRLHIAGYSGTAGDGFDKHNNMKFSTKDVDNDLVSKELKEYDSSCAKRFHGGWWYYKCYRSNLTGQYYKKGVVPDKLFDGIAWKPWKKPNISLKDAIMKIRPLNATD